MGGLLLGWLPMMIEGRSDFPSIGGLLTAIILSVTGIYACYYQRQIGTGFMWAKKFYIASVITSLAAFMVIVLSAAMAARRFFR